MISFVNGAQRLAQRPLIFSFYFSSSGNFWCIRFSGLKPRPRREWVKCKRHLDDWLSNARYFFHSYFPRLALLQPRHPFDKWNAMWNFYLDNNSETIQVLAGTARTPLSASPCVEWKVFVIFLVVFFLHFWITKRIWLYNSFVYIICDREWQQWRWRRRTVIRLNDYPNDGGARTFRFTDAIVFALGNSLELWL